MTCDPTEAELIRKHIGTPPRKALLLNISPTLRSLPDCFCFPVWKKGLSVLNWSMRSLGWNPIQDGDYFFDQLFLYDFEKFLLKIASHRCSKCICEYFDGWLFLFQILTQEAIIFRTIPWRMLCARRCFCARAEQKLQKGDSFQLCLFVRHPSKLYVHTHMHTDTPVDRNRSQNILS